MIYVLEGVKIQGVLREDVLVVGGVGADEHCAFGV
jgi:hypothetical protein